MTLSEVEVNFVVTIDKARGASRDPSAFAELLVTRVVGLRTVLRICCSESMRIKFDVYVSHRRRLQALIFRTLDETHSLDQSSVLASKMSRFVFASEPSTVYDTFPISHDENWQHVGMVESDV